MSKSDPDRDPLGDLIGGIQKGLPAPKIVLPPDPLGVAPPPAAKADFKPDVTWHPKTPAWVAAMQDALAAQEELTKQIEALSETFNGTPINHNILRLYHREIIQGVYVGLTQHYSGYGKTKPAGNDLGPMVCTSIPLTGIGIALSVLSEKHRENAVIKHALEHGIGLYPKTLYAFEWYDSEPRRQEIKDGYVRGP